MINKALYLILGLVVLGATAATEWRGWGTANVSEVKDVPRTVRNNPGSYRPHYVYLGSSFRRGK
ncbi:MAG TPA: hypothetical protein VEU08_21160 [Vicinamibacterales bacterium]|nr:hypothetical protein [Vicinamibacterales bacterium]